MALEKRFSFGGILRPAPELRQGLPGVLKGGREDHPPPQRGLVAVQDQVGAEGLVLVEVQPFGVSRPEPRKACQEGVGHRPELPFARGKDVVVHGEEEARSPVLPPEGLGLFARLPPKVGRVHGPLLFQGLPSGYGHATSVGEPADESGAFYIPPPLRDQGPVDPADGAVLPATGVGDAAVQEVGEVKVLPIPLHGSVKEGPPLHPAALGGGKVNPLAPVGEAYGLNEVHVHLGLVAKVDLLGGVEQGVDVPVVQGLAFGGESARHPNPPFPSGCTGGTSRPDLDAPRR